MIDTMYIEAGDRLILNPQFESWMRGNGIDYETGDIIEFFFMYIEEMIMGGEL